MRIFLGLSMLLAGLFLPAAGAEAQICGDGIVGGIEECDDGSDNSDLEPDACRSDCTLADCGDLVIDSGEECDDGTFNHDLIPDRCRTNCFLPLCGDGTIDFGEQCDDGGASPDCSAGCEIETFLVCSDDLVECLGDRDQCEVDLANCEDGSSEDADGDGEHDDTDRCPITTAGAEVDDGGCSVEQFCASIGATSRQRRLSCRYSDWQNDEPLRSPRDCRVMDGECVPR